MHFIIKYRLKKRRINKYTVRNSLSSRFTGTLDSRQTDFLIQCFSENLEHARHVENERLTFNSIFLALVAGAIAFDEFLKPPMDFLIFLFLIAAGFLSIILTARWNNAFERHLFYAQQCYKLLHKELFSIPTMRHDPEGSQRYREYIDGLDELPLYCFKINHPVAYTKAGRLLFKLNTKTLYTTFYWTVQILLIVCAIMKYAGMF